MRRRFMLLVCGFLLLTLLLPFQAAAAEAGSVVEAESSKSGVTMVAAGGGHSLALKKDGTVWAWGTNYYGQLGTWKHKKPMILRFKCRVSMRWSPSLRVLTIVWRSKATEPSGRGEVISMANWASGRTTWTVLPPFR